MSEHYKRRSGGQPGNQNAKKHSFYSKHLDKAKRREIRAAAALAGPDAEIALMRMKIVDILRDDPGNHKVLMQAVSTLAKLLRLKHQIGDDKKQLREALNNVVRDVWEPLGFRYSDDGDLIPPPRRERTQEYAKAGIRGSFL